MTMKPIHLSRRTPNVPTHTLGGEKTTVVTGFFTEGFSFTYYSLCAIFGTDLV